MCDILEEVLDISELFHQSRLEFFTKLATHFDFGF